MLPASSHERCRSNVQIDRLSKFPGPSNSLFHFISWLRIASGISSAGKCSSLQSRFSKHSSFLVSAKIFFGGGGVDKEHYLPGDVSEWKMKETSARSKRLY